MSLCREKIDWLARHSKGHHSSFKDLKNQMNRYVRHLSFEDTPTHKSSCKFYKGWVTVMAFMMVVITSCGEQGFSVGTVKSTPQENVLPKGKSASDSVQYYFEQARLGIGDAYVKMAQFYRDGTLGKPNLLKVICMGFMAEEYMAIPNMDALFKDVPDSDVTKIAFQAVDMLNQVEDEDTLMVSANKLLSQGIPEGYAIKAAIAWKKGEIDKATALCEKAIADGSAVADVFKDIILGGTNFGEDLNPKTLLKIADRFPMAYRLLGDYYAKIPNDSVTDIPLARQYYLKASDHACLGRQQALWVLETIYIKGYPAVDSLIDKRLWSLGRNEINDSVIWLP